MSRSCGSGIVLCAASLCSLLADTEHERIPEGSRISVGYTINEAR